MRRFFTPFVYTSFVLFMSTWAFWFGDLLNPSVNRRRHACRTSSLFTLSVILTGAHYFIGVPNFAHKCGYHMVQFYSIWSLLLYLKGGLKVLKRQTVYVSVRAKDDARSEPVSLTCSGHHSWTT